MSYEKYLTQEEMKEIAKDTFRDLLREKKENDIARIVANISYEVVFKIVDEQYDEKLNYVIAEKVEKIIEELSEFSVFRPRAVFEREESPAYKVLMQSVLDRKEMIGNQIEKHISKISKDDVVEYLLDSDGPEITVKF